MEKRRSKMCNSCIYRTGELTRNVRKHPCHEHELFSGDNTVACAGSCRRDGYELVSTPTPDAAKFAHIKKQFVASVVEIRLRKGHGIRKMSDIVRRYGTKWK